MKKVKDVEINKPDLTSVKLVPLTQKKYFKNIFLATGLSVLIHTGLFVGVYCQAANNTGSQLAGHEGIKVEIDLRSLNPTNLANPSAHVTGANEIAQANEPSEASQNKSKQNIPIKKNKAPVKNSPLAQANKNETLAKQTQANSQASAVSGPSSGPSSNPSSNPSGPSHQGLSSPLSNSGHTQGQGNDGTTNTGGNSTPRIINNPKPNYPALARQRGQEGLVLLIVQVDEKGQPGPIEIKTSSGYPMLDQAALKGIQKWKFQPASLAGLPMAGSVLVPVEFKLQD